MLRVRSLFSVLIITQFALFSPAYAARPSNIDFDLAVATRTQAVVDQITTDLVNGSSPTTVAVSALRKFKTIGGAPLDPLVLQTAIVESLRRAGVTVSLAEVQSTFANHLPSVQAALAKGQINISPKDLGTSQPSEVAFLGGLDTFFILCGTTPVATAACLAVGGVLVVVGVVALVSILTQKPDVCRKVGKPTSSDYDDRPMVCAPAK